MSYYGNGNNYYNPNIPPSHTYQTSYNPAEPTADNSENTADGRSSYAYTGATPRRNSVAMRQSDELFMGGTTAGAPGQSSGYQYPPQPQHQHQQQYNPQHYSSPVVAQPNPQAFGGVNTTFPPLTHQPYNPALYADSTLTRTSTVSHSYGFSPASPAVSTSSYHSPTFQQHSQFGRTASVQSARPTYAPPAPPPLPVPPGSAQSPAEDWGTYPTWQPSVASPTHGYHRSSDTSHAPLPSPPTHDPRYTSLEAINSHVAPADYSNRLPQTPPAPQAPPHRSPQRQDTLGHRPLPPPPPPNESDSDGYYGDQNGDAYQQEDLFNQVEALASGATSGYQAPVQIQYPDSGQYYDQPEQSYPARNGAPINGQHLAPYPVQDVYPTSDESDVEAAAGLAALRMAEEQEEAEEARRRTGSAGLFSTYTSMPTPHVPTANQPTVPEEASDSDVVPYDVGSMGGNVLPHITYGGDPNQLASGPPNHYDSQSHTLSTSGSLRRSEAAHDGYDPTHPFPSYSTNARVDTFGTGGLEEPSDRRRSYDEGDEVGLMDYSTAAAGEPPDMFYHPGMSTRRPLPPPPASSESRTTYNHQSTSSTGSYEYWRNSRASESTYAESVGLQSPTGTLVPRSTSLLQHNHTPQAIPLPRSKTDAEQNHRARQANRSTYYGTAGESDGNTLTPGSAEAVAIDLPTLPAGKRFNPSKLSSRDFDRCTEPWALSSIISWLKTMTEGEQDLKEGPITEGLIALFTHKVPTMNIADAETLSSRVVAGMYKAGVLVHEEEWLKFSTETMTGVIFQLTGAGCYAPFLHETPTPGRCYSHHCQRTLKKLDLQQAGATPQSDDWATFYKLKKEDVEKVDKKEVERQNILHEIVQGEDNYIQRLDVLRTLYRDRLASASPPVIPPKKLNKFLKDVFGKIDAVRAANAEHLLPQMKYRQHEQGPWLVGFSDIFREWIRKAKAAYIEYAAAFPYATFLVRQEADRNILFRTFLDEARAHKLSNKLSWDTYLKGPITRLQHYGLLLSTVLKKSTVDNEEKRNLQIAMEEIKAVTIECDNRVAEMSRKVDLTDLQAKLILRPGMQRVELNLDHLGRELIFKGDLQRMGGNRFTWLETHALLFDHYLVLAKTVTYREADGVTKSEKYDVSRLPIPMDLLVLESEDDDPVIKSAVKGIAAVSTVAGKSSASEARLGRVTTGTPAPGSLQHTNTSTSVGSNNTSNSGKTGGSASTIDASKDEKIMYPFRIKHLGKETYTLFAPTAQNRAEWCDKIIIAKTRHAAALFAQNAEPFRLRVMADAAFAYESAMPAQKSITIKGTPLDRSIEEVEKLFANSGRPVPICRARVNCATAFQQPYGKAMVAVGTDIGVYISEYNNPRGWTKAIQIPKVTQLAVLEQFSLMLLISDKSLIAYHLDAVCPANGGPAGSSDSHRRAPQKLSGARDVGFFATGVMKERTLVFYKKREGLSSTFKVLEPVYQKSTEKKSRWLKSGRTEFFREYDEFYIPADCYSINLFHSSLAISTAKGFEVLTLDKKQPWSVPDLKAPHVATIASRLAGQDPLGMFRLSDQEFLLCYEECAVYVNKHGDISRSVIMEFVGKAKSAALYGPYVLLFDPDFVEIRNAQNGRLRQVIAGREVKCLDDGGGGAGAGGAGMKRTVKLCLQHPGVEKCQIVVELVLNEGLKE
ncbi:uncharacterized protein EI97DRAFT_492149 [Westerdykella ornata]|uniref:Rho1 guanine nucleotide exchange factor 3 n=1 Tax=Westerdykella ornata TaxID=318751 RepID=A0A6A6JT99_WESOR|nr:uncharacterized protein EI97DRAFT_492149 [Westerdykella ornata]KAF2279587.1 hypothetical protein EI97DRAFT_492149 [Westerdykella ornata]